MGNTVYALARLCLRQEEELTELRQEKGFLLHMTTSQFGILKPLVQASVEWNAMRDSGKVNCNLRTCLFRLMMQELIARLKKLQETPQSISCPPVFFSLRRDGPCSSQGLVPCVGRHSVPQRTAKQTLQQPKIITPIG